MAHHIFGNYVLTSIPNAFNSKTSWWLSKKGMTCALYCFSTEKGDLSDESTRLFPHAPDIAALSKVKNIFGDGNIYSITRWETHYERNQGISTCGASHLSLEDALDIFAKEIEDYPCVEIRCDGEAVCIGGCEADVSVPKWLCLGKAKIPAEKKPQQDELSYQLQHISDYIALFEAQITQRGEKNV